MKKIAMVAVVVAMSFAAQANAEEGNLSNELLASTGLSGMQLMSDVDGESVRGMGTAIVFGASYSSAWDYNAYTAGINGYYGSGYHNAYGKSYSKSATYYGSTSYSYGSSSVHVH